MVQVAHPDKREIIIVLAKNITANRITVRKK
jgi:hypothetical protein